MVNFYVDVKLKYDQILIVFSKGASIYLCYCPLPDHLIQINLYSTLGIWPNFSDDIPKIILLDSACLCCAHDFDGLAQDTYCFIMSKGLFFHIN